jgi:hypothetical protein
MKEQLATYCKRKPLATRYAVSIRTIHTWMTLGLLVFFRVRRIVRFDVAACDASLKKHGYIP